MQRTLITFGLGLLSLTLVASCGKEHPETGELELATAGVPLEGRSGKVIETMNAGGYTYIHVEAAGTSFWAAAPELAVKVGDAVVVPEGMPMTNFRSDALNRSFDLLYFVEGVSVNGSAMAGGEVPMMPPGHPNVRARAGMDAATMSFEGIEKPRDGVRIADLYAQKAQLAGKTITVRAKVVKFSAQIMDTNWIHLQDGTGESGQDDLTVTSDAVVKVGDTVLVKGTLTRDRDFGYGYVYEVMIEGGDVMVE